MRPCCRHPAKAGQNWLQRIPSGEQDCAVCCTEPRGCFTEDHDLRSGLLAPRWRDDARGVIVGLTSYATKAHIVRAMLEAMCFQTREVVDAMRQDADLSHLKVCVMQCTLRPHNRRVNKCLSRERHANANAACLLARAEAQRRIDASQRTVDWRLLQLQVRVYSALSKHTVTFYHICWLERP